MNSLATFHGRDRSSSDTGFLAVAVYLAALIAGQAAEVEVLGFLSMRPILTDLAPEIERATGDRLAASFDPVVSMRNRVLVR